MVAQFLAGTELEGWQPLTAIPNTAGNGYIGIALQAPVELETGKPNAFIFRGKDGDIILRHSDLFFLTIEIAHRWANTDDFDEIEECNIAEMLAVISAFRIDLGSVDTIMAALASNLAKNFSSQNGSEGEEVTT